VLSLSAPDGATQLDQIRSEHFLAMRLAPANPTGAAATGQSNLDARSAIDAVIALLVDPTPRPEEQILAQWSSSPSQPRCCRHTPALRSVAGTV